MSVEREPPPVWRPPSTPTAPVRPVAGPTSTAQSRALAAERGAFSKALERAARADAAQERRSGLAEERSGDASRPAGDAPADAARPVTGRDGRDGAGRGSGGEGRAFEARDGDASPRTGRGPVERSAREAAPRRAVRDDATNASAGDARDAARAGEDADDAQDAAGRDAGGANAPERATGPGGPAFGSGGAARGARAGGRGSDDADDAPGGAEPAASVPAATSGSTGTLEGAADRPSESAATAEATRAAADLAGRLLDAPTRVRGDGREWCFTVLGGAGDVASLRLRRAGDGAWHVRVGLRGDPGSPGAASAERELGERLREAGVELAEFSVAGPDADPRVDGSAS